LSSPMKLLGADLEFVSLGQLESLLLYQSSLPFAQGKQTLSSPMKLLGADLESKLVNYNNNSIDKWCLSNTAIDVDKNPNSSPPSNHI
ncbi:hypothetical protein ACUOFC_48135, partial [Escherichia sp. TWPC-MK]